MLALAPEGLIVLELLEPSDRSHRDHDVDAITRTSNGVWKCADGVFGTHRGGANRAATARTELWLIAFRSSHRNRVLADAAWVLTPPGSPEPIPVVRCAAVSRQKLSSPSVFPNRAAVSFGRQRRTELAPGGGMSE
jgi:hypothetical protein